MSCPGIVTQSQRCSAFIWAAALHRAKASWASGREGTTLAHQACISSMDRFPAVRTTPPSPPCDLIPFEMSTHRTVPSRGVSTLSFGAPGSARTFVFGSVRRSCRRTTPSPSMRRARRSPCRRPTRGSSTSPFRTVTTLQRARPSTKATRTTLSICHHRAARSREEPSSRSTEKERAGTPRPYPRNPLRESRPGGRSLAPAPPPVCGDLQLQSPRRW